MKKIYTLFCLGLIGTQMSCSLLPDAHEQAGADLKPVTSTQAIAIQPGAYRNMTVEAVGPYDGYVGQLAVGKTIRIGWEGFNTDNFHHVRLELVDPNNNITLIAKEVIHYPYNGSRYSVDWAVIKNANFFQYPTEPWNMPSGTYRIRFTPLVWNNRVLVPAPGVWELPVSISNYLFGGHYVWAPEAVFERAFTCKDDIVLTWDVSRFNSSTVNIYVVDHVGSVDTGIGGMPFHDRKLITVPNNGRYDVRYDNHDNTLQNIFFRISDSNTPDDYEITNIIPYKGDECSGGVVSRPGL